MTFDEAIKRLSQDIDKNGGQEKYQKEVVATLKSLRAEYAPTVELAQEQYDVLGELDIDIIKQVLLHPETIKVIGEKNDN